MNQFIALTCFAVCFCINKLERKKKITLGLSPENRAFIALPAGAVASKKKVQVHLWSPFLSMPPEGFMVLTYRTLPTLCLGNPCIREAQDEPPSQEAQDREHAEQAQIGEQVEKQLSSPSNQSFFRGTCGAAKIWYNLVLRRQVSVMRFFFFSSLLMQKHTAKQVNAAMN